MCKNWPENLKVEDLVENKGQDEVRISTRLLNAGRTDCVGSRTVSWRSGVFTSLRHSSCSPSYDRSIPSFKVSSPHRASSFNFQQPLFSLRTSSSCLRLLPHLPVPSILPAIFPTISSFRMLFLRKMWPIQLTFLLLIARRNFLSSLTLCSTPFLTR